MTFTKIVNIEVPEDEIKRMINVGIHLGCTTKLAVDTVIASWNDCGMAGMVEDDIIKEVQKRISKMLEEEEEE